MQIVYTFIVILFDNKFNKISTFFDYIQKKRIVKLKSIKTQILKDDERLPQNISTNLVVSN